MDSTVYKGRKIAVIILSVLLFGAVVLKGALNNTGSDSISPQPPDGVSSLSGGTGEKTQLRGIWINYYEFSDMIKNKSEEEFRTSAAECSAKLYSSGFNAVILHVRSHCDAFYPSAIFPWSYYINGCQGEGVDYDPLKIFIDEAHKAGLYLHAWVNPFRVLTGSTSVGMLSEGNEIRKILEDDDTGNDSRVCAASGGLYLNPADDDNRRLIISGIKEIIDNYEVDGIHFDDYFYPSEDESVDGSDYASYCEGAVSPMPLDEWRTTQINLLISSVYSTIKASGRKIVFGISPQADIEKNKTVQYADVEKWCEGGYVDYLCPQLYFGFEYPDESFRFESLFEKWKRLCAGRVELYAGLAFYKTGRADASSDEWKTASDIISRQITMTLADSAYSGFAIYNYSSFYSPEELNTSGRLSAEKAIAEAIKENANEQK